MKVDLRILQDETVQRFNKETDTAVLEASKEDPGLLKYQSDHCKLMVECQNIIDMYIDKGHNVDNVDCLQICGLDLVILNLSLSAPGLYVANETKLLRANKKSWTRGTWVAYRDSKSKLPHSPHNLTI
ncbi:hypothetical protein BD770DRAFT_327602 [Pilaira anomala]|nr:hypothetical protein BD770DRAFT_327602 [Pilaira anomala]